MNYRVLFTGCVIDAAVRYPDELKASGDKITPKMWRDKAERLTAHKDGLYLRMKAMRDDIKAVEKIRKTADSLAKTQNFEKKEPEHER